MDLYDLWLSSCNISNLIKLQLIKKFKNSKEIWYYCIKDDDTLNLKVKNKLKLSWKADKLKKTQEIIEKNNIKCVNYLDEDYPNNLRYLEDAPINLFYKGNIKKLNEGVNVSVIGARDCTFYGIQAAQSIVTNLIKNKNNINIISGMAKGIDKYAHSTCADNNGFTCAVLGCGVDIVYPKENEELYFKLIDNGCIISEFIPGTKPYSYNFPTRNRIISGLSKLLIVIEAGQKSGSLITANCALNQGKDVVAVPGSIFSKQSIGTNKLIYDGAYPYLNINNVFELLGIDINLDDSKKELSNDQKNNKTYSKIYNLINDSPIHIDDIIKMCNVDISQLYDVLFEMQFNNEIMCLSGNYYVKVHNT